MDNLSRRLKTIPAKLRGFTMMEMIVVMVIISIMAAFALPRFINIDSQARQSSVDSVAASLNTATAMNFAKRKANANNPDSSKFDDCSVAATLLPGGSVPSGYSVTPLVVAENAEVLCKAFYIGSGQSATFVGLGVS